MHFKYLPIFSFTLHLPFQYICSTNPGAKDKIIVEMKPDSPAEESVLLTGSQEKKPSDQVLYSLQF